MAKQYGFIRSFAEKNNDEEILNTVNINYNVSASTRGIDMLLNKYNKKDYQTEVIMQTSGDESVPVLEKSIKEATLALVTDGGLVPKDNPDNLTPHNSSNFFKYSIKGKDSLEPSDYEVCHQGYNNEFVNGNPNRLLPVDALRLSVNKGKLGGLYDYFYTTAGVMTSVENSINIGKSIAKQLKDDGVDCVMLISTCGTSTRCGAYILKEIEKLGIPTLQVTALTRIAEGFNINRILKGYNVNYVFGNPYISLESEYEIRTEMVERALGMFGSKLGFGGADTNFEI